MRGSEASLNIFLLPWVLLALAVGLAGAGLAASPALAQTGLAYTVEIEGVEDAGLRTLLHQSSQLVALRETPPATVTGIRRRAQDDVGRLAAALRSEGYYDGTVTYRVERDQTPVLVRLIAAPGERYKLRNFDIVYAAPVPERFPASINDLEDARGQPATGRRVIALEADVINRLHNGGYPFAEAGERVAEAHIHEARLDVGLTIDPGRMMRFGAVTIEGLERTDEDFIRERITWRAAEPFNRQKLRDLDAALQGTGLFSNVSVEPAVQANDDGTLDVRIEAQERAPRTIGAGLRYGTSEGAGARVYWEHRNIMGRGERLRLELEAAEIRQVASAQLRQAGFLRPDQDLISEISLFNIVAESYDETGGSASIGLTRRLSDVLTAQAGLEGRISVVDEGEVRRDTRLLRVPVGLAFDNADSVFDPTEGVRASIRLSPTIGTSETGLLYVKGEVRAATYYAVDANDRIILAMRTRVGSVFGEGNSDLPASERFYSGGGGSVRGIGYQLAGPIDADRDPVGGRSVFEIGAEARLRVTDRFGIVPFVEGGSVFTSDIPDFGEDLYWGVGVGLRYYTRFGPIRLDIATPLDRRAEIDGVVQFYISLGQAF